MPPRQKPSKPRLSFDETMAALEAAGTAQARRTYKRHGASDPMFGVSFATLQVLRKRIGVDHELACALWDSGNYDAQNLAAKVVDPTQMGPDDLDRWARHPTSRMCSGYPAMLAAEGPHGPARLVHWLASSDPSLRCAGWSLLGQLAQREAGVSDDEFVARVQEIERTLHAAPNEERDAMLRALIQLGTRSVTLRDLVLAAAARIGPVSVDYGDTDCKIPDVSSSLTKAWAHSTGKGFESPAAHERTRELLRLRC